MNIGIMKQSKSILFKQDKWGPIGGDNEAPAFIYMLAKKYPQHTFWIIGKSDYSKTFDKPLLPNIKDLWSKEYWENGVNPNSWVKLPYEESEQEHLKYYSYINDALKRANINLDFCFVLGGMHFSCGRLYYVKKEKNPNEWVRTLENAYKYQSYQNEFLDEIRPKYTVINTDPRHATGCHPKDLVHMPVVYLSQINKELRFSCIDKFYPRGIKYKNWINKHLNVYSGVETMHMLLKTPQEIDYNRTGFALILNQGYPGTAKTKPPRYIELNKYILSDKDFDCSIYGKWDEDIIASDSRFKGPISPLEVQDKLRKIKYTLCIPISSGWATAKFTEMAHCGVIPFVTNDYASEANVEYIHPFLKISSKEELKRKIAQIDDDEQLYKGILLWLKKQINKMYTGEYLLNTAMPILKRYDIDFGECADLEYHIAHYYNKDYEESLINKDINNSVNCDDLFG